MKKKMAQIVTRLDYGGVPDIFRIACEACAKDYEVTIILGPSLHMTPKTKKFLADFSGKVVKISSLKREINPFLDTVAFVKLFFLCLINRFDVVHTHTAKAGILGRIAAKFAGVDRVVHMPHGHNFYGYFGRTMSTIVVWSERFASKFTDRLIVLTELEKKDYVCRNIIAENKIVVVPSGQELDEFKIFRTVDRHFKRSSLDIKDDQKVIAMVSRLAPVKGPDLFIKAAEILLKKRKDVLFLLVGDGELHEELQEYVILNNLDEHVRFLGWHDDALEIIFISDVILQPSRNEAVGRTLIEAQLLGVPVVASRVGGIPEIILEGKTGDLFSLGDMNDLISKLNKLLDDEGYRSQISVEAKKWAEENFSAEVMIEKIKQTYE